ncbi:NUDIX hydrolase [Streptomyces sp. BBFR25]|uniref:NUDIX hydrolase n=1 Tax=Streptomyces sp. BBFR25 TaxID=3372855 RepID=UPI0037DD05E4
MGLDLFDVERLLLTEAAEPPLPPQDATARDRVWDTAVKANPVLFDGPAVACGELERTGPGVLRLSWVRVTYRHYALRRVPGATALPSLFVNVVQPTDDGRVLAARMSPSTAAPGRWQLPGGSVEPPQDGAVLDEAALACQAARELAEELGVAASAEDLELCVVTRGESGSVGLTYLARPFPRQRCALTSPLQRQPSAARAANPISTPSCRWAHRTTWPVWTARTRMAASA